MIKQAWLAGLMMCLTTGVLADHCPEDKLTSGEPEHVLVNISIKHDTIQSVFANLGTPTKRKEGRHSNDPAGSGWAEYTWKRPDYTITVSTEFHTTDSVTRVEVLEIVTLSGEPATQVRGTGRGLRLGDEFARATDLYGTTYVAGTVTGPQLADRTITYCFSDNTELSMGFDDAGRLVSMRLAPAAHN